MAIGDRVRERRETLGMNQTELAKAVKARGGSLSQGQISSLEAGSVDRPRSLPELALALRTTVDWLLNDSETASPKPEPGHNSVSIHRANGAPIATAPDPLIVWRSAPSSGRAGETLIYKEQVGVATRPVELSFSREAFAHRVVDDEAAPRYERSATLLVDPSSPAADGDDCLFVRDADDNPMSTITRRLIRATADHWIVRKWDKGAREQKLNRSDWPLAWPIFGSYNRQ